MSVELSDPPDVLRQKLLSLKSPKDLASLLDVEYSKLIYHIYKTPEDRKYSEFFISKRSGGTRTIRAPISPIKIIQRKLNQVLQAVYEPKASVHSFISGKSIVSNADIHKRRRYVLNLDLEDFFPSINFGRVRGMFMAVPYSLPHTVATVLAQICCSHNAIPQGAPSSPIISNMICSTLDSRLLRLAQMNRCDYTRYADDLTFSTSMPNFPTTLADVDNAGAIGLGQELEAAIRQNGFRINQGKIRLSTNHRRQEVTGLTVNKFPNPPRRFIRQIQAMLHAWDKFGIDAAQQHFTSLYDTQHRNPKLPPRRFDLAVVGRIEFVGMVRGKDDPLYLRLREWLRSIAPQYVPNSPSEFDTLQALYLSLEDSDDPQRRGYILQDLLRRLFVLSEIPMARSFTRSKGGEQIDGAFNHDGWFYLVECRWRKKLADIRELDGLSGQVRRSGRQVMGFFISINGWSENVVPLLLQEGDHSIVLMDGTDVLSVLTQELPLTQLIDAKLSKLNVENEPFYSASQLLSDLESSQDG
ncbi:MAG: reverse transcriptase domain-containing protein [Anaerolineales bacterium]